jgi:hypothetical protein
MTLQEKLEKKVHDYCINNNRALVENSLYYVGLNPEAGSPSGEVRPMHIVSFDVWAIKDVTTQSNFVHIDPITEKLVLLITPHTWKMLDG